MTHQTSSNDRRRRKEKSTTMSARSTTNQQDVQQQVAKEEIKRNFKNIIVVLCCLFCSLVFSSILRNPIGNYLPIFLIATFEWYRSYPKSKRSYYGLFRLILYLFFITLWIVLLLKFTLEGLAWLVGYKNIPIRGIEHLFPYALIFTSFARTKSNMSLHDKRRYVIHLLYDAPALLLVLIFKLFNDPLNSLFSQITDRCYLGCLPLPSDVKLLNEQNIKRVINMCAEYSGPRKTYQQFGIKQLYLPTVDSTAPSLETIEKAMEFLKEAYERQENFFVHCKSGMARSATIVLCNLIVNEQMSPEDALKLLKEKRPEVSSSILTFSTVKRFLKSIAHQ